MFLKTINEFRSAIHHPFTSIICLDSNSITDRQVENIVQQGTLGFNCLAYTPAGTFDSNTKKLISDKTLDNVLKAEKVKGYDQKSCLIVKRTSGQLRNPAVIDVMKHIIELNNSKENFEFKFVIVDNDLEKIPPELKKYTAFIKIPLPNEQDRFEVVGDFIKDLGLNIKAEIHKNIANTLAGLTHSCIEEILVKAYQRGGNITSADIPFIKEERKKHLTKDSLVQICDTDEGLDVLGGMDNLKEHIKKDAEIFKNRAAAKKYGVTLPRGILLSGHPGCGKTLVAKAISKELGVPLLIGNMSDLADKYYGETEKNLKKVLKTADEIGPCVLFFDEFEKSLAGRSDDSSSSAIASRLLGNLLIWSQEHTSEAYLVITVNDLSKIPPELLRKGRFDELYYVDLPTMEERQDIFTIHLKKKNHWSNQIDTVKLAQNTELFSGAEIESVVNNAIKDDFLRGKKGLTTDLLLNIAKSTTPLARAREDRIEALRKSYLEANLTPASSLYITQEQRDDE